jgi:hypothetical protein
VHARIVDARPVVTVCAYEEDSLVGYAHLQVTIAKLLAGWIEVRASQVGGGANAGLAPSEMGLPFSVSRVYEISCVTGRKCQKSIGEENDTH